MSRAGPAIDLTEQRKHSVTKKVNISQAITQRHFTVVPSVHYRDCLLYLAGLVVTFIYPPYHRSSTKYLIRWLFLKLHLPLLYSHRFVPLTARNEQSLPRWLICFVAPTCSSVLLPNLSVALSHPASTRGRLPATAFGIPLSYGRRANNHTDQPLLPHSLPTLSRRGGASNGN